MQRPSETRTYSRQDSVVFRKTTESFGGLSNMAGGFPLNVNGLRIFTAEALYQACRFPHRPEVQRLIIGHASPMTAKMKSKPYRHDSRPDWDQVRVKIMRWSLRVKLAQNWIKFSELLLATGDRPIVEESRKDDFWGAKPVDEDALVGTNVLGRLLMELREAVKNDGQDSLLRVDPLAIPDFLLDGRPIQTVIIDAAERYAPILPTTERPERTVTATTDAIQVSLFEQSAVKEAPAPYLLPGNAQVAAIAGLKPYPVMKDSDVPWLGAVPEHWEVQRGKWLFRHQKQVNADRANLNVLSLTLRGVVNNDPENPEGLVPKDYATYQLFRKGDLVFKLIDLENLRTSRVGLVHEDGIMSSAYVRLTPQTVGDNRFFFQQYFDLYQRGIYNQLGAGVRSTLGPNDLLNLSVVIPPLPEQSVIVRFLDHAGRRIRRCIRAKQKLIKLLEEQKQAIIHRAVTRGLDSNVRLKPSGVEWLGEVPEHWEVRRVKQVARILRGKFTHRPRNDPSLYDGRYPFIQTGEVARSIKTITAYRQTLNERGLAVSKMFPAGTLVMTIAANIGDVAVLDFEACFPDSIVGFVPQSGCERDFLYYAFRAMKPELLCEAPVNTQGNLNVDRIGSRGIGFPSAVEQARIVHHIDETTVSLTGAIDRAHREISLLREYRTRLIADVVTGKLDVREAAVKLPDEFGEPEALDDAEALTESEEAAESGPDAAAEEAEA